MQVMIKCVAGPNAQVPFTWPLTAGGSVPTVGQPDKSQLLVFVCTALDGKGNLSSARESAVGALWLLES